jgi:hypothetical protein
VEALAGTGPWTLPIAGFKVERISFDVYLETCGGVDTTLYAYGEGAEEAVIGLSSDLDLRNPAGESVQLDWGSWKGLAPLIALRSEEIEHVAVGLRSELEVRAMAQR